MQWFSFDNRVGKNRFSWSSWGASLISATVENATPTNVVLTFPSAKSLVDTDFTCTVNGIARVISSASWTGGVLTLVLSSAIIYSDDVVVAFVETGGTTAITNNVAAQIVTTVITTGNAQTLSLGLLDVKAGETVTVDWGDSSTTDYTEIGNGSARTHLYATTDTFTVKISNSLAITSINWNDSKLRVNSSMYKQCGSNLTSVSHSTALTTPVINSADMTHLTLSYQLSLFFTQAGTYTINSDHFKAYTLSYRLSLYFSQAGTYTINSDHFKAYTLSYQLSLNFTQAGTYTITRSDFSGFIRVATVSINMGLLAADVDKILLGFYDAFPSKTNTGGTITLTGNEAPTGTYQAQVSPTTGKEAAYELLNDSGEVSALHWATITVQGGGTP